MDILDNLHVYFIHGFDTGFRVKKKLWNDNKENEANISSLTKHIKSKRDGLIENRGGNKDIVQNNKFVTTLSLVHYTQNYKYLICYIFEKQIMMIMMIMTNI